jgi:RNA polymerase sigma-70 factor (ECF subfamily)
MELYEAHSTGLHKYLRGLGLVREEAEDMVQEAFLRLANHLIAGGEDINLRSWLYQVGHNLSMDIHREHSWSITSSDITNEILGDLVDPNIDPEGTFLHEERIMRVNQAMTRLTPKQRSGVLLRSQGLRYMEIASVLNVSESRAIHLVKRGLILLAGGL